MKNFIVIFSFLTLSSISQQVVEGGGVSLCYQCTVSCKYPAKQQCPNMFGDFRCYSAKILQPPDGRIEYTKGCVLADDIGMINLCKVFNQTEGQNCYFCDSNLCNDHD